MEAKLASILDKVEGKAEVLGSLYGAVQWPAMSGGEGLLPNAMQAIQGWKPKDPLWVANFMLKPGSYEQTAFMGHVATAIIGYGLAEFGGIFDSRIAKLGRITKKFGASSALAFYLSGFLWWPQFNPAGGVAMGTYTQSQNRPAGAGAGYGYPASTMNLGGPGYPHSWSAPDGYRATLKTESIMP